MSAGRSVKSQTVDWNTPPKYIDAVLRVLGSVDLDPCSNEHSLVPAGVAYAPPTDGLAESWDHGTIFVNPPYGRDAERRTSLRDWVARALRAHREHGAEVLMLIPVATNTSHWKEMIFPHAAGVCFLSDTRLRFYLGGSEYRKGAPMACAMVYFGHRLNLFHEVFCDYGAVVTTARVDRQS